MTLSDRIKLINGLIKENTDSTIADHFEALAEIESIEHIVKNEDMAKQIDEEQRREIVALSKTLTPAQIQEQTDYAFSTIYRALQLAGIDYKADTKKRLEIKRQEREAQRATEVIVKKPIRKPVKEPFRRPPAEYSNHSPYGIATEFHNQKAAS